MRRRALSQAVLEIKASPAFQGRAEHSRAGQRRGLESSRAAGANAEPPEPGEKQPRVLPAVDRGLSLTSYFVPGLGWLSPCPLQIH